MSKIINWVPFGIRWENSSARVDWCDVGQTRLTDPFFDQTIHRCLAQGHGPSYRVTSLAALDDLPVAGPPAGFIFHLSRCGSTLVTQMLASVPRFSVISEASILSSILHSSAQFSGADQECRTDLLRTVVNALAQPRAGRDTPCFIKFNSRSVLDISLIQRAFPDVPWVFLYREPLEVMSALLRTRNDVLPPGLIDSGLLHADVATLKAMRPVEFWARALARCCQAALQAFEFPQARFINYRQLPDVVWTSLLSHFDVAGSDDEIQTMRAASRFNAKNPGKLYVDDAARKQSQATAEMRAATDEFLSTLYERLETTRLSSVSEVQRTV